MAMAGLLTRKDQRQLAQWLNQPTARFKLLYRASRDGCSAAAFHAKCDNQGPTVTVTSNAANYTFGGYAKQPFEATTGGWKKDPAAFLFTLAQAGKVSYQDYPSTGHSNIFCATNYGPAFGSPTSGWFFLSLMYNDGQTHQQQGGFYQPKTEINLYDVNTYAANVGHVAFHNRGQAADSLNGGNVQFQDIEVYQVDESQHALLDDDVPWRKVKIGWEPEAKENLQQEIAGYSPPECLALSKVKIMMVGQIAAGKSSFYNTISSVYKGRISGRAVTGDVEHSLTNMFRTYEVRSGGQSLDFQLCDTMGLEEDQGLSVTDLTYILDGNIPNKFQFNPTVPITPDTADFKKDPKLKDKIHVLAFVLDGSTFSVMPKSILEKLRALRTQVNSRRIPLVVLVTKIDKLCEDVKEDVRRVYHSMQIQETVQEISEKLGIRSAHILPVKNYDSEVETETAIDILALFTMKRLLELAEDYLDDQIDYLNLEDTAAATNKRGGAEAAKNF